MSENGHKPPYFEFADFRLYPHERLLTRNDERIPLTPRVLDLLIELVVHHGQLLDKETLFQTVWAGRFVEDGNLNRTISTLRKNLGNGKDFIETVPKVGYRFTAPVTIVEADESSYPSPARRKPRSRSIWLFGIPLVLGIVLIGAYFFVASPPPITRDGLTRLTNNLAEDEWPDWSPDGKKVAFVSNRDGAKNIYVMSADGSGVVRLTNGSSDNDVPGWSADGTRIIFVSMRDGNPEIYIMNADGSGQTRLTVNSVVDGGPPKFSPDGKKIVFSRSSSNEGEAYYNFDIYTMNVDGTDVRQLTTDPEYDAGPHWSPDGTKIAFLSAREKNYDAFIMNTDGSDQVNLTNSKENESPNGWTVDGKQIFLNVQPPIQGSSNQLDIINGDGTGRRRLTSLTEKSYHISYSPVAGKLAFALTKDGNYEIYTTDAPDFPR